MKKAPLPHRSPLKEAPLRNPGQGLDEWISSLFSNWMTGYGVVVAGLVFLAIMEWVGALANLPRLPWLYTIIAAIAIGFATRDLMRVKRKLQRAKLGRDGERAVAQILAANFGNDARVFHDVPGEGFNLDHVVICPRGIYVIETKTFSKRPGDARVVFDGKRVLVDGRAPSRDPVIQVRAAAGWLKRLLQDSTHRSLEVRGIVAFPGWYVENSRARGSDIWVLEPKAIAKWIGNEPVSLASADVALVADRVARQVRNG